MKFTLTRSIQILERTPIVLNSLLEGLDEGWITSHEGENTWSPYDVIGHLIHGEVTDWIPRTKIILSDAPNKTFELFDRFAQFENSQGKNLTQLLQEFSELRAQNIATLKGFELTETDLTKTGQHPDPALGTVTLKQLLTTWTVHDLSHINQISRVMMKQYREEMGPWPQYFSQLR